ncbi:mechanosensitive ion channel protein 6 [Eucalyptus grandis]|uniref:mechanosensitive ion channel protein 6 n=1 Tax=Eucalyptus grandis TaxID=71139 RepID=UPI00192F00A1|nr:mechanosensitive ion channel protein 6 [Eucalyptus grandis]
MDRSINFGSQGGEIAVNCESSESSSKETVMNRSNTPGTFERPRPSFYEVLNEALRRQSQDTSDRLSYQSRSSPDGSSRESPWTKVVWSKVKSQLTHLHGKETRQPDEHKDDLVEDLPEELKKMTFGAFLILQCLVLLIIVLALICSLSISSLKKRTLWDLPIWKWEAMVLALVSGHLVSSCVVRVVVKVVERVFLLHRRVLYFIYGLWRAVRNCLWLGLVLLVWHLAFHPQMEKKAGGRALPYVTRVLGCFLVASVIWLLKTLLVKVLASSFHVNTYFERIHEALFDQFVIETLSAKAAIRYNAGEEECGDASRTTELQHVNAPSNDLRERLLPKGDRSMKSGRSTDHPKIGGSADLAGRRINQKSALALNIGRMMDIIQHETLSTLDEKILDSNLEDGSSMEIGNEGQAKEVAKKIFLNVAKPGSKQICKDDLMQFMNKDEAAKIINRAAPGKRVIDETSLESWVINAFKERKALARSLNDTNTAVDDLHNMLNVLVAIITAVIWLIILGVPIMQFLVFISSQFLLLAFVFGNSCKMVFEAIIFLFVMHPYDVGDFCEVDGVLMFVEEMNILTTVFRKLDNLKIRHPNSVLATKAISNYNRSTEMVEIINFCLHISTPMGKINKLKKRIERDVESRSNHWHPNPMVLIRDLEDMNKITMTLWLVHRIKHHDNKGRLMRRAALIENLIEIFRQEEIEYRMLPLDVNVRNLPSPTSDRLPSNWTACATEHRKLTNRDDQEKPIYGVKA